MNTDTAISVSHVSKRYTIGVQKDGSLRGTLAGLIGSKSANKQEEFWALDDVSFDIKKGEVFGIIGKNGAGKSTLLKILSQITKPTSGRIEISGRVASLLEVGTGFHPELSGRENIYLNGTILGMTRQEVKDKFDEIVAFSGVEKFIDTPVKHYSSGMYVRLAFAVAAHLEPEILIIDEVLAVGDAEFQKRCLGKMKEVAGHGRTVIFVSHNMAAVRNLCTRGIVISVGKKMFDGEINDAVEAYMKKEISYDVLSNRKDRIGSESFKYTGIKIFNESNVEVNELISGLAYKIQFHYTSKFEFSKNMFHWGITLLDKYDNRIFAFSSIESGIRIKINEGNGYFTWEIPQLPLRGGQYFLNLFASQNTTHRDDILDMIEHACVVHVHPGDFWNTKTINRNAEEVIIAGRIYE